MKPEFWDRLVEIARLAPAEPPAEMLADGFRGRRLEQPLLCPCPAHDAAGNAADREDRRQVQNDLVSSQVIHGKMLMRRTESAIATEPGWRSVKE